MSYHLYGSPETLAIGLSSPVIKSAERAAFADALSLKSALLDMQSNVQTRCSAAFSAAEKQGFIAGRDSATQMATTAIAELAARIDAFEVERRTQIADAAFAAVQAIVGALDNHIVLAGIINQTIDRLDAQTDAVVAIEIAPDMLAQLAARLPADAAKRLIANPALNPCDCNVVTRNGRLVANLDIQLESLAARWGIAHPPPTSASPSPIDEPAGSA